MPKLSTDDGPRRLRAVWLGPNGATLPFEWTYVQWAVVIATAVLLGDVVGLFAWWWTGDVVYTGAALVLWGWPGGGYLGVRAMRGVSFDQPLRYKIALHRGEQSRQLVPDHGVRRAWAPPKIHDVDLDPARWTTEGLR